MGINSSKSKSRKREYDFSKPPHRSNPIEVSEHGQDGTAPFTNAKREKIIYESKPRDYWEEQRQEAHRKLKIDTVNDCNVAFCGKVGSGKSCMINALRQVKKGEPEWAPVFAFQSTTDVKPYRFNHPNFKHLVLWDTPGCSTGDVPADSYFFEQKLFAFDFLVIMSDGFPGTAECGLAREARKFGVPFAFVQSKCDKELRSLAEDNNEEVVSDRLKNKFRDEQKQNFKTIVTGDIKDAGHFLVSSSVMLDSEKNSQYMLDEEKLKNYVLEIVIARRGLHEKTGENIPSKSYSQNTIDFRSNMPADVVGGHVTQNIKQSAVMPNTSQLSMNKEQQHSAARRKLNIDPEHSYNIGFCGDMKAGKSRLINALQCIDNNWYDSAPVSSFETGSPMMPYRVREGKLKGAVLWDVPGYNRGNEQDYFDNNNLSAMDLLVIMCEGHFDKKEADLARTALAYGLLVNFVCSKSDAKLRVESEHANPTDSEKRRFIDKQNSAFEENMPSELWKMPRFWISATVIAKEAKYAPFDLDDDKFVKSLIDQLKRKFSKDQEPLIKL